MSNEIRETATGYEIWCCGRKLIVMDERADAQYFMASCVKDYRFIPRNLKSKEYRK